MAQITTVRHGKITAEIHVDDRGTFTAEIDDVEYSAKTLAEVVEKAKKALKRLSRNKQQVKVTVLGVMLNPHKGFENVERDPEGVVHAFLRGKHERNHEWLFTSESGIKFKLRTWNDSAKVCPRLNEVMVTQYQKLARAVKAADASLEQFVEQHAEDVEQIYKKGGA